MIESELNKKVAQNDFQTQTNGPDIVEEIVVDNYGKSTTIKYVKGKLLGKVLINSSSYNICV